MRREDLFALQNQLLLLAASGVGLKGLIQSLSEWVHKPILLTNFSFSILASSIGGPFKEKEFVSFFIENPETGSGILKGEREQAPALMISIKTSRETLGYLFMLDPGPDTPALIELGKQVALVFALELNKYHAIISLERSHREVFIFDLLYGNIESNQEIFDRGEVLGWDMHQPHSVIVFEIDRYEHFSKDHQLVTLLYEIIETVLKELDTRGILMRKKGEVILILPMLKPTRREQRAFIRLIIDKVKALAEKRLVDRSLRIGVGRNYDEPHDIFRSYQEAKVALELGNLMHSQVSTPFFVEMGLARILYNHDKQDLKAFYLETLGDLERFDQAQSGDLMDTLEKFLIYQFDLKKTADALFLHPNTLRYRLKKIEEILDVKLTDLDTRLNLLAALKIKYLRKF